MKKGLTELVFIIDRSGSMEGIESDTIGGVMHKQGKARFAKGIHRMEDIADIINRAHEAEACFCQAKSAYGVGAWLLGCGLCRYRSLCDYWLD